VVLPASPSCRKIRINPGLGTHLFLESEDNL
jgi:hypothetical protein